MMYMMYANAGRTTGLATARAERRCRAGKRARWLSPLGPDGIGWDDGAVAQKLASGSFTLHADGALWLHT